ncbi:MAG: hypothetical protein ACLTXI_10255 [Collinsella sp.]
MRTGDLIAALGGRRLHRGRPRGRRVQRAAQQRVQPRHREGQPQRGLPALPAPPFADQSGDAGFTRTPSDDACAYTWISRSPSAAATATSRLPGGPEHRRRRGRTLAADGTWMRRARPPSPRARTAA